MSSSTESSLYEHLWAKASSLVQIKYPWMISTPEGNPVQTQPSDSAEIVNKLCQEDYRGFLFVLHHNHGLLLLHCNRKKNKPPHYQLPGGHVDREELEQAAAAAAVNFSDHPEHVLYMAARAGAARELLEETGMNVTSHLDRILPVSLLSSHEPSSHKNEKKLPNEYKDRLFFVLQVSDDDFYQPKENDTTRVVRAHGEFGREKLLTLSLEHQGFKFEPNPDLAITLLEHHSGGKVAEALRRALLPLVEE